MASDGNNKYPTINIISGATINFQQNGAPYPLQGNTIVAQGSFKIIDAGGNEHTYEAATKTNSKISNQGVWT
jgi:hypothetical protein